MIFEALVGTAEAFIGGLFALKSHKDLTQYWEAHRSLARAEIDYYAILACLLIKTHPKLDEIEIKGWIELIKYIERSSDDMPLDKTILNELSKNNKLLPNFPLEQILALNDAELQKKQIPRCIDEIKQLREYFTKVEEIEEKGNLDKYFAKHEEILSTVLGSAWTGVKTTLTLGTNKLSDSHPVIILLLAGLFFVAGIFFPIFANDDNLGKNASKGSTIAITIAIFAFTAILLDMALENFRARKRAAANSLIKVNKYLREIFVEIQLLPRLIILACQKAEINLEKIFPNVFTDLKTVIEIFDNLTKVNNADENLARLTQLLPKKPEKSESTKQTPSKTSPNTPSEEQLKAKELTREDLQQEMSSSDSTTTTPIKKCMDDLKKHKEAAKQAIYDALKNPDLNESEQLKMFEVELLLLILGAPKPLHVSGRMLTDALVAKRNPDNTGKSTEEILSNLSTPFSGKATETLILKPDPAPAEVAELERNSRKYIKKVEKTFLENYCCNGCCKHLDSSNIFRLFARDRIIAENLQKNQNEHMQAVAEEQIKTISKTG